MDLLNQNRTYHRAQSSMELLPNYYAWTYGKFLTLIGGNVIELGCGSGLGIGTYIDLADKVYAVDFNVDLLGRISQKFSTDKVTTVQADLLADWGALENINADVVIMMDVLEHFHDDLALLKKAATLLAKNGRILIKVPAQSALYSDMDKASGHYRRYDPADLEKLAAAAGLRLRFAKPVNTLGALAYRFKNTESSNFSRSFSPGQLKMINRAIPLIRLGDYLTFLPGLSLICVME